MDGTEANRQREYWRLRGRARRAKGRTNQCLRCQREFWAATAGAKYCQQCKHEQGECVDCGRETNCHPNSINGVPPSLCCECKKKRAKKRKRFEYEKRKALPKQAKPPRIGVCRRCSKQVLARSCKGATPAICGDCKKIEARERHARGFTRQCHGCRVSFVGNSGRKYCDGCWIRLFKTPEIVDCQNCGKAYKKSKSGGNSFGKYCSRKCTGEARIKAGLARQAIRKAERDAASQARQHERLLRQRAQQYAKEAKSLAEWMHQWDAPFRSARIRERMPPRGCQKHTTRARKRGLPRSYSKQMSLVCVGERDGWICGLCKDTIPDHLSRSGPRAPCVDHIVPLNHKLNTRHGHTPDNVQIAHRECNEAKGCTVACHSLFECDNPREHISNAQVDQTPPGWQRIGKSFFA